MVDFLLVIFEYEGTLSHSFFKDVGMANIIFNDLTN